MIARLVGPAFFALVWSSVALANHLVLSDGGTELGRFRVSDVSPSLSLTVDLAGDVPEATFVMARFQNNQPVQRSPSGDWIPWNESADGLVDNGLLPSADGTLTFELTRIDLSAQFLPIIFTVAYQTEAGIKSGYVVIDQ